MWKRGGPDAVETEKGGGTQNQAAGTVVVVGWLQTRSPMSAQGWRARRSKREQKRALRASVALPTSARLFNCCPRPRTRMEPIAGLFFRHRRRFGLNAADKPKQGRDNNLQFYSGTTPQPFPGSKNNLLLPHKAVQQRCRVDERADVNDGDGSPTRELGVLTVTFFSYSRTALPNDSVDVLSWPCPLHLDRRSLIMVCIGTVPGHERLGWLGFTVVW